MTAAMQRKGRSLEIPGVTHGSAPIPMGARVGNVIYSSGIAGRDPATGLLPEDVARQAAWAFSNMKALLDAGDATLDAVVRMTVFITDDSARAAVNEQWLKYFPDPHDRPARHTVVHNLPGGMLVQLEIVAVLAS
jgi:2-iminobutanoate/2-iminopropanoate deaminase